VIAVQQGADLKIISDNVQTVAEFVWAVPKNSSIQAPKDSRARRSATPTALDQPGARPSRVGGRRAQADDAELVKTGGLAEGIVALDLGAVDIAPTRAALVAAQGEVPRGHPASDTRRRSTTWSAYHLQGRATRGDFLRAVLRGRRKRSSSSMQSRRGRRDIAKVYNPVAGGHDGGGPQT